MVIFSSCQKNIYSSENELPPFLFPNIQEANSYIQEKFKNINVDYAVVINNLHLSFIHSGYPFLMGYNWFSGVILADLDKDGIYELYLNASIGSGIIHSFIHGYNPKNSKYYIVSKRFEADYLFFIYENNLYVLEIPSWGVPLSEERIYKIYKPVILNDEFTLEEMEKNIQDKIHGSILIENIYNPFKGDTWNKAKNNY